MSVSPSSATSVICPGLKSTSFSIDIHVTKPGAENEAYLQVKVELLETPNPNIIGLRSSHYFFLTIWRSECPKDAGVFCAGAHLSGLVGWLLRAPGILLCLPREIKVLLDAERRPQMNYCRCLNHGHIIGMHEEIANHRERFAACFHHARWRAWTQTWPGLQGWKKSHKSFSCIDLVWTRYDSDHHCFMLFPQIWIPGVGFLPVNFALGRF